MLPDRSSEQDRHSFWQAKRVVVTGGAGFVGSHLINQLETLEPKEIFVPRSREFDLVNADACREVVEGKNIVIHLAARVGGIGYNREHPAELFRDNLLMGTNMMEAARLAGVSKFVGVG